MNGVSGRMGTNQHLIRSILALRAEGGVRLKDGSRIVPEPVLVGRDRPKLERLAQAHGLTRIATDLGQALAERGDPVYFDAVATERRKANLEQAVAAGKHIYTEKPTAMSTADALSLYRQARKAGIKHGVVQDKLFLPGLVKLRRLREGGFFGRILSVKGDFGYWVFPGDGLPAQRPSWNYRKSAGGGIILDMLCHWRYVLDNLFGEVRAVSCRGAVLVGRRWDERGEPYAADAEDAAFATFELEGGVIAQVNSSWQTRVRRDDLVTFQVDGTEGSAIAGLTRCWIQPKAATRRFLRRLAGSARRGGLSQRLQGAMGAVHPPRHGGRALRLGSARRRQRRAARGARLSELGRAPLDRRAAAGRLTWRRSTCRPRIVGLRLTPHARHGISRLGPAASIAWHWRRRTWSPTP
jgi:predicted dehydrogenase